MGGIAALSHTAQIGKASSIALLLGCCLSYLPLSATGQESNGPHSLNTRNGQDQTNEDARIAASDDDEAANTLARGNLEDQQADEKHEESSRNSEDGVQDPPSPRPIIDLPTWVYIGFFVAIAAFLLWTYLRVRWIRIGLIGTVVTGFFIIPGMHLVIDSLGPLKGIDWRLSDPDVPAAFLGSIAIVALAILEWPYSQADYVSLLNRKAETRAQIMSKAVELVIAQHIGSGTPLDQIARDNKLAEADLYAALRCITKTQSLLGG